MPAFIKLESGRLLNLDRARFFAPALSKQGKFWAVFDADDCGNEEVSAADFAAIERLYCPEVEPACRTIEKLERALSAMLDAFEDVPPLPNCSCHISAPCADCVDHAGEREAIAEARAALNFKEPTP